MKNFKTYISEAYKNYIGLDAKSIEGRRQYVDQVWDILQKSYSAMGGIKGSGFESKEAMITKLPFWKLFVRDGKVLFAIFYKDKGGRKMVASGTDGTDEAKKILANVMQQSLKVSFGEKSGPALGFAVKVLGQDIKQYLINPNDLGKISGDEIIPLSKFGIDNLDPKDRLTYDRFPDLRPYFYVREIGGEWHLKISMGTPNLPIKNY